MISVLFAFRYLLTCKGCRLAHTRRNVVLGRGVLPCKLLLIGEAPGKSEDVLHEAFVGAAGKLLDTILFDAGLATVPTFITNVVLCRPCDSYGGDNREPDADEVLACAGNVQQLISAAAPRAVVLMGIVAQRYLKKEFPFATTIRHPAALLREGGKTSPFYLNTIRALEAVKHELED
jgi:DNA polymerase